MNNFFLLQKTHTICSKQNSQVKELQKIIFSNKYRHTKKLLWIEGKKLCESYFQNIKNPKKITFVFDASTNKDNIRMFLKENIGIDINFICLKSDLFREISQIENSSGWGIIVQFPKIQTKRMSMDDLIILDGIQDPGNLGNIIRTSAAAGIVNIWLTNGTTDPFSPKVLRAGSGGQFLIKFSFFSDLKEILKRHEITQMQVLATELKGESINLFHKKVDLRHKCAWVFGSEGMGLSQELVKKNKLLSLKVPHSKKIDSLNVASAVAICLFEMKRQRSM
ncbi:MAG: hypothetical protein CBC01_04980 [Betaproteobacteria bacterium TMED41]|nr:MAG: hypothetical protein CBC01_04980 [Betaproteobacteria bacterium TMED41]